MPSVRSLAFPEPVVTLAVPAVLGFDGIARFQQALHDALRDRSVRVILLRGNSDVFCRGMDLSEIAVDNDTASTPPWEAATRSYADVLVSLRESPAITVALVEGPALGGGVGMAAACDVVLATEAAKFALPELLFGIVPAIILPVLADRVGLHCSKRWALTQATWTTDEALVAGLVDQSVKADRIASQLNRIVRGFTRAHPRGVAALKRLCREIVATDSRHAIDQGRLALNDLLSQVETRRDIVAFRDYGLLPGEADA